MLGLHMGLFFYLPPNIFSRERHVLLLNVIQLGIFAGVAVAVAVAVFVAVVAICRAFSFSNVPGLRLRYFFFEWISLVV